MHIELTILPYNGTSATTSARTRSGIRGITKHKRLIHLQPVSTGISPSSTMVIGWFPKLCGWTSTTTAGFLSNSIDFVVCSPVEAQLQHGISKSHDLRFTDGQELKRIACKIKMLCSHSAVRAWHVPHLARLAAQSSSVSSGSVSCPGEELSASSPSSRSVLPQARPPANPALPLFFDPTSGAAISLF